MFEIQLETDNSAYTLVPTKDKDLAEALAKAGAETEAGAEAGAEAEAVIYLKKVIFQGFEEDFKDPSKESTDVPIQKNQFL